MKLLPRITADKIAKLIPRLASDHEGEVIATVSAIGRTLTAAGRDWHDLAECITFAIDPFDIVTRPTPAAQPESPRPKHAEKPKREPTPWPTFSTLRHSGHCEWLRRVETVLGTGVPAAFLDLRTKLIQRPHELLTRKEVNLFNRLVRETWLATHHPSQEAA